MHCLHCQNSQISQDWEKYSGRVKKYNPEDLLQMARGRHLTAIAYTYNEPTVWFEFVKETSILLRSQKIAVVLVTNGYISAAPRSELLEFTDAMNIDLKGFSDETYFHLGGSLNPVLETIASSFVKRPSLTRSTAILRAACAVLLPFLV